MNPSLQLAHERISECLLHGRDHLNLAGLGLTDAELGAPFEHEGETMSFGQLTALQYLDLTENKLTVPPAVLLGFSDLVWLGLNFNQLTVVNGVEHLVKLQRLYLRGNEIVDLPDQIGALSALVELDLTGNALLVLPSSMGHLKSLEYVQLTPDTLPHDLRAVWGEGDWSALRDHLLRTDQQAHEAFLRSPNFKQMHASFAITGRFSDLARQAASSFEFNQLLAAHRDEIFPASTPTPEIQTKLPAYPLAKLILVGTLDQGKTTLQEALRGLPFQPNRQSTLGMNRERLSLSPCGDLIRESDRAKQPGPQEEIIDFEIWDLGGQKEFQFTNRMFYSPEAIYLAVLRAERDETNKPVLRGVARASMMETLEAVRRRTDGKAEVFIVITDCPKAPPGHDTLITEFSEAVNEMIKGVVWVDCDGRQLPDSDGTGIRGLRERIASLVMDDSSRHRHQWQQGWHAVIESLRTEKEVVKWSRIEELCEEHQVQGGRAMAAPIVRMGHDIGYLLWRSDREKRQTPGEQLVILDPNWLSRAVVRLLNDQQTDINHGFVDSARRKEVWSYTDDEGYVGYEESDHETLMELMQINDIAYRHTEKTGTEAGEWLLVAQKVKMHPPTDLDAQWAALKDGLEHETVRLVTFPHHKTDDEAEIPDLMYSLIVRLRNYSLGRFHYREAIHWRSGLLVKTDEPQRSAARIEWVGKTLRIEVAFDQHDTFVQTIIDYLYEDHLKEAYQVRREVHVACPLTICAKKPPGMGRFAVDHLKENYPGHVNCLKCGKKAEYHEVMPYAHVPPRPMDKLEAILSEVVALRAEAARRDDVTRVEKAVWDEGRGTRQMVRDTGEKVIGAVAGHADRILACVSASLDETLDKIKEAGVNIISSQRALADEMIRMMADDSINGPRLFSVRRADRKHVLDINLTHYDLIASVWCEECLQPLPFITNTLGDGEFQFQVEREYLRLLRPVLRYSIVAGLAMCSAGAVGLGCSEAVLQQFASGWEPTKELLAVIEAGESVVHAGASKAVHSDVISESGRVGFGVMDRLEDPKMTAKLRERARMESGDLYWGLKRVQSERQNNRWLWQHPDWKKRFS